MGEKVAKHYSRGLDDEEAGVCKKSQYPKIIHKMSDLWDKWEDVAGIEYSQTEGMDSDHYTRIPSTLRVNHPGDECEREGDRVAEAVMRIHSKQSTYSSSSLRPSFQPGGNERGFISKVPPVITNILASSGIALDSGISTFMGERFRFDFVIVFQDNPENLSRTPQV